jgi:hypothetical protein
MSEFNWFQAIPAGQFNGASLSGTFQPVFTTGFAHSIKVMTLYNGFTSAMDYSFDGTNLAGVLPPGGTMVIDIQANHRDNSESGAGTLYGKLGQNVWVRTSVNPTYLTVGGFY